MCTLTRVNNDRTERFSGLHLLNVSKVILQFHLFLFLSLSLSFFLSLFLSLSLSLSLSSSSLSLVLYSRKRIASRLQMNKICGMLWFSCLQLYLMSRSNFEWSKLLRRFIGRIYVNYVRWRASKIALTILFPFMKWNQESQTFPWNLFFPSLHWNTE